MREGEKGLVKNYRLYLKTLETEIKRESCGRSPFVQADVVYREITAGERRVALPVRLVDVGDAFQLCGEHHGYRCCTAQSTVVG